MTKQLNDRISTTNQTIWKCQVSKIFRVDQKVCFALGSFSYN